MYVLLCVDYVKILRKTKNPISESVVFLNGISACWCKQRDFNEFQV